VTAFVNDSKTNMIGGKLFLFQKKRRKKKNVQRERYSIWIS